MPSGRATGSDMLVKAALIFLLVMGALGLWGRARARRRDPRITGRKPDRIARYCGECGTPRIGKAPCPCGARG